eukprot:s462_g62.t1
MDYQSIQSHPVQEHEDGMTVIDSYVDETRPLALNEVDMDQAILMQNAPPLLVLSDAHHCPSDKIDGEQQHIRHEMAQIGQRNAMVPQALQDQPPVLHELYMMFFHPDDHRAAPRTPELVLETWYSDHDRRPHNGLSRQVRLTHDFSTWFHDIVMTWEEWIDPFRPVSWYLVQPHPDPGSEALAHVVIVQHPHQGQCSIVTAIYHFADDPWHPRLLCLRVPARLSHSLLKTFVDLDGLCDQPSGLHCRSWLAEQEVTDLSWFDVQHGAMISFSVQRSELVLPVVDETEPGDLDAASSTSTSLLQVRVSRTRTPLKLDELVDPPRWTQVDCQKVLFLPNQLLGMPLFHPVLDVTHIWWHDATWAWLRWLPVWSGEEVNGLTMYTGGSAHRQRGTAAAGVVLLIHTHSGLRWGGYLSTLCPAGSTAPRAEAAALCLAMLWLQQWTRTSVHPAFWCKIAYDCEHTANVAQGRQAPHCHHDLHVLTRSLVQWLEECIGQRSYWTHHRSHTRHPWNEAVDTVCRFAQESACGTVDLQEHADLLLFQSQDNVAIQWLWLLEKSLRGHPDAPPLHGTFWRFDVAAPFACQPDWQLHPAVQRRRDEAPPRDVCHVLKLRFATANVLTLFPDNTTAAAFLSARAEVLAGQLLAAGIQIVWLQETRSGSLGIRTLIIFMCCHHLLPPVAMEEFSFGFAKSLTLMMAPSMLMLLTCGSCMPVLGAWWFVGPMQVFISFCLCFMLLLMTMNEFFSPSGMLPLPRCRLLTVPGTRLCSLMQTAELVLLPLPLFMIIKPTLRMTKVDLAVNRLDHFCVCADVLVPFYPVDRRARDQRLPPTAASAPARTPWHLDVHTHAVRLHRWLRARQHLPKVWRKQHLTDETKKLVEAKRFHWRRLCDLRRVHRRGVLYQLFHSWRHSRSASNEFQPWLRQCDHALAWHQHAYDQLVPHVVRAVRDDDRSFYENLAATAGVESTKGCRAMWAAIQHVTYEALAQACHDAQRAAALDLPLQVQLEDLPSRIDVEACGSRLQVRRAAGLDTVAPATVRQACIDDSEALHQLFMKAWLLGAEPIQYKGGLLHAIGKKDGGCQVHQMRGIMLVDIAGKMLHALLRRQFLPALLHHRHPLQLGGFPRKSIVFATHYVRSVVALAAAQHLSSAILFVDIRSAFHSMIREFVFAQTGSLHPRLVQVLLDAGIDIDGLRTSLATCELDAHAPLQLAFQKLGLAAPVVAWVDDLAIPVFAEGAAVLAFRGSGAATCRKLRLVEHCGRVPVPHSDWPLCCNPVYEHLGTSFQSDGDISAEIQHRVRKAVHAYCQVRRPVLSNKHVPIATRLRLLDSLVMPVLLRGSCNWPMLTVQYLHRLTAVYGKWARSLIGNGFWAMDQLTDQHLFMIWNLPTISMRLAKARILYAFHWITDAPSVLVDFVTAVATLPRSWFHALRQAIAWFVQQDETFFHGCPFAAPVEHICQWLVDHRLDGPRRVRRLFRAALHHARVVGEALSHHYELQRVLRKGGMIFQEVSDTVPTPALPFACHLCDRTFGTDRILQVHLWGAHGETTDERRLMTSTTCPACWQCFWTVNRLQIHLRQSRRYRGGCFEQLTWRCIPADEPPAIEFEDDILGQYPRLPAVLVPHVPPRLAVELTSRDQALAAWQQRWEAEDMPAVYDETWGSQCFQQLDLVMMKHGHDDCLDLDGLLWDLSGLVDGDSLPRAPAGMGQWALGLWMLDQLCYWCGELWASISCYSLFGPPIAWRETGVLAAAYGCGVIVIGGSPVLGRSCFLKQKFACCLLTPQLMLALVTWGLARTIRWCWTLPSVGPSACLTGPPCETFSAARHLELDDDRGPRPLRSSAHPWCLPSRSGKELRQLSTGTGLLMHSQQLEAATVTAGGASLMEHPWENGDEDKVSVWRTSAHSSWMMALPSAHRRYIEQWAFGSLGVKPTCLRAINMGPPSIVEGALREGQELWRSKPSNPLKGRTVDGAYRTAAAKEYSIALRRSLLVATLRSVRHRMQSEGVAERVQISATESQWLADAWSASSQMTRKSFLPDYQGRSIREPCKTARGDSLRPNENK